MPYNGQGTFVPKHVWVNEAAAGTAMLPANFDDQDNDIGTGLSNAITRDGQGGPTADIPWNNYGIIGMRDPTISTGAATKNYVDTVDAATRTWVQTTTTALPAQTGNAGTVLTTNGTQASWSTCTLPTGAGTLALRSDVEIQLLAQATVTTAVATIDFLTLFSSTYDKYIIEVEAATPSASDTLQIRLAKAGAADASTVYYNSNVGSVSNTSASAAFSLSTNLATKVGATVTIRDANNPTDFKVIESMGFQYSNSNYYAANYIASYVSANIVTGFRMFWASGANFTKGTVRIYGIKNS